MILCILERFSIALKVMQNFIKCIEYDGFQQGRLKDLLMYDMLLKNMECSVQKAIFPIEFQYFFFKPINIELTC